MKVLGVLCFAAGIILPGVIVYVLGLDTPAAIILGGACGGLGGVVGVTLFLS